MPFYIRIAAAALLFAASAVVCRAEPIPLEVKNPGGAAVAGWPITTGVPFPPGALRAPDAVRLRDASGREVPLQAARTGVHRDGSVRWLLLDFQADVPAEGRRLSLEFGEGVTRAPVPAPLRVVDGEAAIEVDTGALRFTVSKKRFSGLERAWVGGREISAGGTEGGPYFVDDQGREFRAGLDPSPEVSVESAGPLRTVITARGWYQHASGERRCRYIARIHAYAGKPYVRLFTTWIMTEDSRTLRFRDIGFRVPLPVERCAFGLAGGRRHTAPVAAGQAPYLVQFDVDKARVSPPPAGGAPGPGGGGVAPGRAAPPGGRGAGGIWGFFVWFPGGGAPRGGGGPTPEQAEGWIAAAGPAGRCTLAVRDFRQLFPKELGASPAGVSFHVWPAHGVANPGRKVDDALLQYAWFCHEGPVLDFQAPDNFVNHVGERTENEYRYLRSAKNANAMGLAKTHEVLLAFAPGGTEAPAPDAAVTAAFQQPPACLADPAWMCASGVFGAIEPARPDRFAAYERLISGNFDAERRMEAHTRDYGMWNYGDSHTSWDMSRRRWDDAYRTWRNTHHGAPRVPWLLYVRSGDPKYLAYGIRNTRHVLDVDYCHWSTPAFEALEYPQGKLKGALNDYKGIVHWHSGNRLMDYNSMADFSLWYYHLTGDRWGLEVALDWGEAVRKRFTAPFGSRSGAGTMDALIPLYQETWDPEVKRIIDAFFNHMTTKVQNLDGSVIYSDHVLAYWPHFKGKKTPVGSFPEWENYAPWLQNYCDLTDDPKAKKALVAWADSYLEGYGDMCSLFNIGDYINVLGYAYLFTRDPKYLARGVREADRAANSTYAGDDPLLKGLLLLGQTSLSGYTIQRLPTLMKALAVHGRPVEPEPPSFIARAGFPLLLERSRPVVDGKPTKVETVEAWVYEAQDGEFRVTLHTAHSYDQRAYTVTVMSPGGKEAARLAETYAKGAKDLVVAVPKDGETGVYRVRVSAPGSYGQVSSPIGVEPALPVAFPLPGRIVPLAGAAYYFLVPEKTGAFTVSMAAVVAGTVAGQIASPDRKTARYFTAQSDGKPAAGPRVEPPPAQTGVPWRLGLDGSPAVIAFAGEGAEIPPILFQDAYPAPVCQAFVAAAARK